MKPTNESRPAFPISGRASSLGLRAGAEAVSRPVAERTPALRSLLVEVPDEAMVIDERSDLTPAQMVESKLMVRLRESSLPVSHLQMRGLLRYRGQA